VVYLRASPTVLQFSFCKTRSLPSLKSICQVTKLSVSNGFGKIELAKSNGGPGRYFFMRFFSSRRPLHRRRVWRCFCREADGGTCWLCVTIGTAARVEGFLREANGSAWWDFVSRRGDRDFVSPEAELPIRQGGAAAPASDGGKPLPSLLPQARRGHHKQSCVELRRGGVRPPAARLKLI